MRSVNKQHGTQLRADSSNAAWRTSSRCSHGDCVEVGALPARAVAVRDTKNHGSGPDLVFTPTAWRFFVAGVKHTRTAG